MWLLLLPFLGIASAGRLGHHTDHHGTTESQLPVVTRIFTWDGIMKFEDHDCILRNGVYVIRGPPVTDIGTQGDFEVLAGFANTIKGERVHIYGGSVTSARLSSTNPVISNSLARAGITLDQFIQLTGTVPLQQGVLDISAGALSINGNLRNFVSGVFVVLSIELVETTNTGGGPGGCVPGSSRQVDCNTCTCFANGFESCTRRACPPTDESTGGSCVEGSTWQDDCNTCTCINGIPACTFQLCPPGEQQPTGPAGSGEVVETVTVTETAVFVTQTVVEPVTLIKTQTIDQFETVTAPNYASVLVSVTNIVKQTQTVTEEEVIRSPVAGAIVVNTVPVTSETVINVQAKTTNYFVRTVTDQVSPVHTHFVTIHSIRTNTVDHPATSTITQVISQTRVSTIYKTSVVGSTVYTTSTTTITIASAGGTTTVPAGYY